MQANLTPEQQIDAFLRTKIAKTGDKRITKAIITSIKEGKVVYDPIADTFSLTCPVTFA